MAVYDKFARFYDGLFDPFERWFIREWRKEALAELPTGADILEIGCGTGVNFELYPPFNRAISTEVSRKMIEIAVGKARGSILLQADAQHLPFPENSFDAAFATLVFCSIPDPDIAFSELRRVIRPGGTAILLEHVRPPGIAGKAFDLLNIATTALIDDHFNRRTADLAKNAGFEIKDLRVKAAGIVNVLFCRNL
ncbi:MAG: class I SAM-dependent methyltransferase [Acidobacteria bacterium]|nr:class I SAM-dependent methyltransferase [Acidobacteriota bacterium]